MKYGVDVTDEFAVECDLPPGAPVPKSIDLDFEAHTEDELRRLIPMLGFDAAEMDPTRNLHSRYGLPVTRDGEEVASCSVTLWLKGELTEPLPKPPIPVLKRIRDEAQVVEAQEARPTGYVSPPAGVSPGENDEYPADAGASILGGQRDPRTIGGDDA